MFCEQTAMFEHDVQTSRRWAMDGESAAVASYIIMWIRTSRTS